MCEAFIEGHCNRGYVHDKKRVQYMKENGLIKTSPKSKDNESNSVVPSVNDNLLLQSHEEKNASVPNVLHEEKETILNGFESDLNVDICQADQRMGDADDISQQADDDEQSQSQCEDRWKNIGEERTSWSSDDRRNEVIYRPRRSVDYLTRPYEETTSLEEKEYGQIFRLRDRKSKAD